MATSRGLDVSAYQPTQDWAAHKKNGVVFAWAKASEGERTRDAHFADHIKGIKAAGLIPGGYHFAWPTQNVDKEAANYIAAVKPYAGPGFVHWLDLERRSDGANYAGRSNAQIHDWAAKWVQMVSAAFKGQRVGIYTSGDDIAKGHAPAGVPLWYPAYPGSSVDTYAEAEKHAQPKPSGHAPLIWQFTSSPATGPNLDLNLCYKSAADLRTWAGGTTAKPPAPAPTPAPKPTAKPTVDLSKLVAAAKSNPHAKGQPVTYTGVKTVEAALVAEGLLSKQLADGSYGTATITAYTKWQRRCGYTGGGADGIPGKTSLTKLAAKHGFTVVA